MLNKKVASKRSDEIDMNHENISKQKEQKILSQNLG